ncbi:DNA-binding helix-turn-helix protein [uncultured Dysgonomonas sp.]|uniref:DNA-binding helix-turn-helix protein n=1 Tax=uncultured Dysgonomonas sp. TaxID=206096 RepID=A0A212J5Y3_9BACT|nr:helix-turn-helix transcriptional regulator [uncultured Dysgonomonas sp.]SBV94858.1 DNA-binding helix-turn-helix protein [uncultured Dysgonomonas sp.]
MRYRINEICREQGIYLKDLAERMGRTPESLSRSLNNGTTTKMLQEIADNLNVQVVELFDGYKPQMGDNVQNGTIGIIRHNGDTYEINSIEDIKKLLSEIEDNKS